MESSDSGVTCKLLTTVTVFDIDPGFDDSGDGSDEEEPQEQF
jgi:hypothetical protein